MSTELLIRCCAPTLAGMKTGSMYSCPCADRKTLLRELQGMNRLLSPKGLCILPLRFDEGRALLYLFRPGELERDLRCPVARRILEEAGYEDLRLGKCLCCLVRKLQRRQDFPHEVGLFLSYPPEDVRGFIQNRAQNYKRVCAWKVYGDEELAQRTFARYQKCTESYCRAFRAGRKLEELAVAI